MPRSGGNAISRDGSIEHAQWKQHYGDTWEKVLQWKTFYDPSGILNPGFIQFSEPEPDLEPDGEIG